MSDYLTRAQLCVRHTEAYTALMTTNVDSFVFKSERHGRWYRLTRHIVSGHFLFSVERI